MNQAKRKNKSDIKNDHVQDELLERAQFMIQDFLESLHKKRMQYRNDVHKNKSLFYNAIDTSKKELIADIKKLFYEHDRDVPVQLLALFKDVVGSSVWVSRSYMQYLKSISKIPIARKRENPKHDYIIDCIAQDKELYGYSPAQIFSTVFDELCIEHSDHSYISPLRFPKVSCTIVLVSGVLNELYKTAAFERGVRYICETYGLKYVVADVHGRKGSNINARDLEKVLEDYIEDNPNQKIWLLSYSKGGLDSLHFLKRRPKFAKKYILGLSTIASPIQGAQISDHAVVKMLNKLHQMEDSFIYKKLDGKRQILFKDVPKHLSAKFQSRWLKHNYKNLPQSIFYTSLALEAEWYNSHIWMMMAKVLFPKRVPNDGVVDVERAHFPEYMKTTNFGTIKGHHLISARSSSFNQEALIEAHIITLHYLGRLK